MPSIETQAIVLRHANYRDNDRMLTLFSPTLGRIDAIARGCRKTTSALCGATELFCCGDYRFNQSRDRFTLIGCSILESYYPLREDYDRLVYGAYLLALCEASVQPGEKHSELFVQLLAALAHLAYGGEEKPPAALATIFLLQFAQSHGYQPRLDTCAACGTILPDGVPVRFGALVGGLLCTTCGAAGERIQPQTVHFFRAAQREGFDLMPLDAPGEIYLEALQRMRGYLETRVERSIKAGKLLPRA